MVNDDLKELSLSQGINVWSTNQDVLEEQALKELEKFAEEHNKQNLDNLEDGEIIDNTSGISNYKKSGEAVLDIESYIKRQEELKKRQEYKKIPGSK
ncbi:hypothetical protein NQ314_000783 [Rhamnusium bicolor]|uniref:Uncharacterized protein n=1 Tax=Rhamnusium bicolor TaxID=1586634 RepID=A0AAV8ZVR7_9CUCU|nr:hypothetical protein NQ314_000783 [Rhamnusium bicolor]